MKCFLGEVAEIILGGTPSTSNSEYWGGGIPWVSPGDINGFKYIKKTERTITAAGLKNSNTKLLGKGEVIISARGSVGKIVQCIQPMAFNQSCYAIRTKDCNVLVPEYIYYLLHHCVDYLRQNSAGAVFNAIIKTTLERTPITLYPVEIQKRIASILSAYDDLIENNRRRIRLLEQAARLLYREWFVHLRFPGHEHVKINNGLPEGWEKKTAFDVMDVLSGGTPKTKIPAYWNGDIPFYTPKDATECAYVQDTIKSLTEEGLRHCNSKLYPKNTIFITARGTVGKINLAQTSMAMNQSCYALIAHPPVNQYFLYLSLADGVEQFRSRAVGAVFDAIIRDTFKLIPFIVPDDKIINLFTEQAKPVFQQIDILSTENRKLAQARNLLLPRLMNGELTI
ncbi:MAG TPA: restriction endonuclease subunit S [Desulfobulbaceae bacterium]|nr:restriction endonuclease subunit S [Desulfobulbaceae bacterium]